MSTRTVFILVIGLLILFGAMFFKALLMIVAVAVVMYGLQGFFNFRNSQKRRKP